jgi:protein gp138
MDRRGRFQDEISWMRELIDTSLTHTWVAAPGIVKSFSPSDCTASVQVAIMWQARDKTGVWKDQSPAPIIPKALVLFPGNNGFQFTFPLKAGDEGLLVFCDRCIDSWWKQGGVQGQYDIRKHDATDGVFIPGLKSVPNVPSSINSNSAELRSNSGNTKIAFNDTDGIIITTGNKVKINGDLQVSGTIISGYGGSDQVGLQTHIHPSNGSAPTPGT